MRPLLVVLRLIEALIVGAAARRGHSPLLVGGLNLLALVFAVIEDVTRQASRLGKAS